MRQLLIEVCDDYKVVTEKELREMERIDMEFDGFHAHRVVGYCDELIVKKKDKCKECGRVRNEAEVLVWKDLCTDCVKKLKPKTDK